MARTLWRVRDSATFSELRRHGHRSRSGPLTVTWLPGDAGVPPKLAFAVPRKVGSAPVRNRFRRRVRTLFAERAAALPPGTYLVAAAPAAAELDHGALQRTLTLALDRLGPR